MRFVFILMFWRWTMSKENHVNNYVLYAYWYRVFAHVTVAITLKNP